MHYMEFAVGSASIEALASRESSTGRQASSCHACHFDRYSSSTIVTLRRQAGSSSRLRASFPLHLAANLTEVRARQFVNRTKALALYRQFIRATKSLGDARTRWETMEWIRNDFERNRAVVDSVRSRTPCLG